MVCLWDGAYNGTLDAHHISRSSQCSTTGVTKAVVCLWDGTYNGTLDAHHISRSSQCSTTGVTKAVVCAILSVGWCI